jgi:hypothetical protein
VIAYMMSKQGRLNDRAGHWFPHLIFYVPLADSMTWGAGVPGSPLLLNSQFNGAPEPVTEFMVPVSEWSDGTPAAPVQCERNEADYRQKQISTVEQPGTTPDNQMEAST